MKKQLASSMLLSCWVLFFISSAQIAYAAEENLEALQVDPDSKLARWQSGQVYFDGQWRHIEQVQQLVSTDPRWQEYQQRVETANDSTESHAELAYWCQRNGLVHEAKLHWLYVLHANPNHRGALNGLQLMRYRGQLYPIDQINQLKQQAKAGKKAHQKYKPIFLGLRRSIKSGSNAERASALRQLSEVSDPAAIPALMEVAKLQFVEAESPPNKIAGKKEKSFELKLQQAAIASLNNMSSHEATLRLVEIAVLSPYVEVRRSAAESLIPREKTSYMPLLMASLAAPLEAIIDIEQSPGGMLMLSEQIGELGPENEQIAIRSSNFFKRTYYEDQQQYVVHHHQNRANALARVQQTQRNVAATNYSRNQWNTRIDEVLQIAAGQYVNNIPQDWWDYWRDYNELSYPEETPTYVYSKDYSYDRCYLVSSSPSCFAAGTPVWTLNGLAPIESIKMGDLVLSQNPVTGCLDYRPVLQTTVRPPSLSVNLSLKDETIVSTRGHRFWLVGDGWRMAKHLKSGDRLYGAGISSNLEDATEGPEIEAYNLVVGDFHTYFVGHNRLLVHDNGCPIAVQGITPGVNSTPIAAK